MPQRKPCPKRKIGKNGATGDLPDFSNRAWLRLSSLVDYDIQPNCSWTAPILSEDRCPSNEYREALLSKRARDGREAGLSMILVIDNYDSFTYNLVQRLGEIDPRLEVRVFRNDEIDIDGIRQLQPERIIISPGPCTPTEAGISVPILQQLKGEVPILGVCLGHQSIGQAFGGKIVRAPELMHGKTDLIFHDNRGMFAGLANPFVATRYHSLVIEPQSLPDVLEVSAWVHDKQGTRQIMGVRHRTLPIEGWQFHPESFLTEPGVLLLKRFLSWNGPPSD